MEPVVIKISGSLTDQPEQLALIFDYVEQALQQSRSVVLVHGGGKQINALSHRLGVPPKQVQGRRITASEDLEVLKYTVGGSVNINLVSALRERGIQAVGINGTDGELTRSRKREPLLIDECEVDFQLVGEIEHVNPTLLHVLLNAGMLPVVGCLTWSPDEGLLNINADTFAINLASALAARELVMLMEPEAVLDRHGRPVHSMNPEAYETGKKDGWINAGMVPKLYTGFSALKAGIATVRLTNPSGLVRNRGTLLKID